jgi:hypothetical protein
LILSETPGALKRFRRTAWKFQQTFETPLKGLEKFVAATISANESWESACLTFEQVVFDPTHIITLFDSYGITPEYGRGWSLTATGQKEAAELLQAALGDWIDFIFVPAPKPFVIYADHDDFTTFFAMTRSNLNRVANVLTARGFAPVPDYERRL